MGICSLHGREPRRLCARRCISSGRCLTGPDCLRWMPRPIDVRTRHGYRAKFPRVIRSPQWVLRVRVAVRHCSLIVPGVWVRPWLICVLAWWRCLSAALHWASVGSGCLVGCVPWTIFSRVIGQIGTLLGRMGTISAIVPYAIGLEHHVVLPMCFIGNQYFPCKSLVEGAEGLFDSLVLKEGRFLIRSSMVVSAEGCGSR